MLERGVRVPTVIEHPPRRHKRGSGALLYDKLARRPAVQDLVPRVRWSSAAQECADSRACKLGWHFRYATDAGLAVGHDIAQHTVLSASRGA